jgi:hypothetical protein
MAIHNPQHGYRAQSIRCYYWWCIWSFLLNVVILIIFYAGKWKVDEDFRTIFQVILFVGFPIYALGAHFGYKTFAGLVESMAEQLQNGMGGMVVGGMGGMAHVAPAYPVQDASGQAYPAPFSNNARNEGTGDVVQAIPVNSPNAFTGQAHTLGGEPSKDNVDSV